MTPTWQSEDGSIRLYHGDCLGVLGQLEAGSVDAVVTDPPYGLTQNKKGGSGEASLNEKSPAGRSRVTTGGGFMGQKWDAGVPGVPFWEAALRVAKPGAHLLAFGGTRTFHRLACAIEDAGWELRDCVMWVYGSGFPKSLDVSKAIDKAAGAEREVVGFKPRPDGTPRNYADWAGAEGGGATIAREGGNWRPVEDTAPATDAARKWQGWGTALKPAWEPVIVARKPLAGTVAANVLEWGTGAINVDGCRVVHDEECRMMAPSQANIDNPSEKHRQAGRRAAVLELKPNGRWPANLIHDGSDEVVGLFPREAGGRDKRAEVTGTRPGHFVDTGSGNGSGGNNAPTYDDSGSAARFFYCAKASKRDRNEGCEGLPQTLQQSVAQGDKRYGTLPYTNEPREMKPRPRGNHHPTVKPTDLMRYLCRLVTPPGGVVCDPFMGSGSTGKAAVLEGFRFVGIEMETEYIAIAKARMRQAYLFGGKSPCDP